MKKNIIASQESYTYYLSSLLEKKLFNYDEELNHLRNAIIISRSGVDNPYDIAINLSEHYYTFPNGNVWLSAEQILPVAQVWCAAVDEAKRDGRYFLRRYIPEGSTWADLVSFLNGHGYFLKKGYSEHELIVNVGMGIYPEDYLDYTGN